ncbi:MAG: type II toxin-antitoxin system VapC family toxin [Rhodocyclales bacterium]|nr:type II toxin-antitoxin system VapC family toxin [Rhodocyclales bacterium]
MILVDTSIWIDHLSRRDERLFGLLSAGQVLAHPFVTGEVALGNLRQRETVLELLLNLPRATVASDDEVLHLINADRLHGLGVGYVDAHLLASTMLTAGARLWTRDKRLASVAHRLGFDAATSH